MSLVDRLFGISKQKNLKSAKPIASTKSTTATLEKKLEYDFTTPGFTHRVTTGEAVAFNLPHKNIHRVIVNHDGCFENFPGIIQGKWTHNIVGKFNFEAGQIGFRTSFENREGGGWRCLWEIQPDGRYWADEDGFGAEDDAEIILYADLDENGDFISPFRIYEINGRRIEESDPLAQPEEKDETTAESPEAAHEQNVKLAGIVANHIAEELEKPLEKYDKKGVRFPYSRENQKPGPKNYAQLVVSRDSGDEVSVQIGVCRDGTDRLYSNFLFEAGKTQDEVKTWLKNTDTCIPVILKCVEHLSDSVDEYWD